MDDGNDAINPSQAPMSMAEMPTQPLGPPCHICHNQLPPLAVYEINTCGILWIVLTLLLTPCGLCISIYICCKNSEADSCHEPVLKCASCGAKQMPVMQMPMYVASANPSAAPPMA
ncbi:unnamed protein product [Orchesella dallaii]|uniref:LITAF domain-containing protein n=1 Tax=Orchesella dallaii TaxID=48710 RepID=A0ABP1S5R1_9HEXA